MKALDKALYSKLSGSTALASLVGGTAAPRIYNSVAPPNMTMPVVIFHRQGGGNTSETPREEHIVTYAVKALSGSLSDGLDIEEEIHNALYEQDLAVADGYADYAIFEMGHLNFAEHIGGGSVMYHTGRLYRIHAEGTA
jgi:hypothetical protein